MGIGTVVRECRGLFNGLQSLTDCCGGDGTTARAIVKAFPHIKCNVLDLPKLVLHFWSDEDCIKILAQCKEAIPSRETGGKVIIIDIVLGSSLETISETELLMDMLMFICTRGRQRDEKEWSTIFTKAGFSGYKIVKKLGHRGVIEVYP
ncbi:unnamed protein product [Triticum turgidum subsp. durum]|uniref:O-methyltransferase C-terminal domain-containing protein n=1 Tax=Triticum turgidum subsp. durum TaxID=4567 RepID=A0A9R0U4A0_TRITD|nr:unnamed protein product [Triticum turgidum subsp. durum]